MSRLRQLFVNPLENFLFVLVATMSERAGHHGRVSEAPSYFSWVNFVRHSKVEDHGFSRGSDDDVSWAHVVVSEAQLVESAHRVEFS